jgi:hypothetical protein
VLRILRESYPDFGPRLATEKLEARHRRSRAVFRAEALKEGEVQIHWRSNTSLEITTPDNRAFDELMSGWNGVEISVRRVRPAQWP